MKKTIGTILKILPFAIMGILIVAILSSNEDPTVENILSSMPDSMFLSALFLMGMYALKSLSVVFPIIVLQVAAGLMFPLWAALLLNILGTTVAYTIPYITGRFSGSAATEKLMRKYPKVKEIVDMQHSSSWFPSFILRSVSCLPADIISMCLGSVKVPYIPYVVASVVGTLPGLIPATTAGMSILDPTSAVFIFSVILTVLTSVLSIILYWIIRRKKHA